jgi:uncharacterized damage-inducible protein DinB
MSDFERMANHISWANRILVTFIHDHGWNEQPARLMSHVVQAEAVWYNRITGAPADREVFRMLPRFEIEERIDRHRQVVRRLVRDSLNDRIAFRRFSGEAHEATVSEILIHVITHGFHHRGQITAHYAGEGIPPPAIDFLTYANSAGR